MRILITTFFRFPGGGIWTFVIHLKKQLEKQGHHVDLMGHSPDNQYIHIINKNEKIEKQPFLKYIQKILKGSSYKLNSIIYQAELNRYGFEMATASLNLSKYDLIHAQDVIAARAIQRIKPRHVPLVTSIHGYLSGAIYYLLKTNNRNLSDKAIKQLDTYQYYNKLEHLGYHSSDLIHTSSKWMKNNIVTNFSISPNKIITFPYGMDISQLKEKALQHTPVVQKPKNKKIILLTSRLVYLKGIHHLIDALHTLKKKRDDWICWILGDGEMKEELQNKVRKLSIQNDVQFLGKTDNVGFYLNQADIFVLPSLQENQPFALVEAQLFGLPAIVSDSHGLPELVEHGETGFIFSSGNARELQHYLNELLQKDSLRKKMGKNAQLWGEKFWSPIKLGKNAESLYQHALGLYK